MPKQPPVVAQTATPKSRLYLHSFMSAARETGLDRETIAGLVNAGILTTVTLGGSRRYIPHGALLDAIDLDGAARAEAS